MRKRQGFTLFEVLVALVLLGLGLASAQALLTDRLVRNVAQEGQRATAHQLADERIDRILADPDYSQLETRFNGTETPVPGFAGFGRNTWIVNNRKRSGDPAFKTITVRVWHAALRDTVSRTTIRSDQ